MSFQIHSIQESIQLVHGLSSPAQGLFENKQGKIQTRTAENPHETLAGMHQLLSMVQQVEDGKAEDPLSTAEITQIGDYGMQLLMNLYSWAMNHEQENALGNIQQVVISLTDWIMRNDGLLQTLEPIVDTLAVLSNQNQDSGDLQSLC